MTQPQGPDAHVWPRWAPLLLVAVTAAIYANSLQGAWVYDDFTSVVPNESIRKVWPPWEAVYGYPSPKHFDRPVAAYSLALTWALSGYETWGHHLGSVLVHMLATLALYGLIRRALRLPAVAEAFAPAADALALTAALLWCAHPLGVACTSFIVQRAQSLMALFYLFTLYASVRAFTARPPGVWVLVAVLACVLGMGCKQDMVSAPVMVLLLDAVLVSGSLREALRRRWVLHLGLLACWIPLGFLVAYGGMPTIVEEAVDLAWTRAEYGRTQFENIIFYLKLAVWPSGLSMQHYRPVAEGWLAVGLPAAVVVGMLALTGWGLLRRKCWSLPMALFFMALAPSTSLFPTGEIADERRMYLPLAGVCVLAVGSVWFALLRGIDVTSRPRWKPVAAWVAVIALALMWSVLTVRRNRIFDSHATFWQSVADAYPDSPRGHNNLGIVLERLGQLPEAKACFEQAVKVGPEHAWANLNLANLLLREGRTEEALRHLEVARREPFLASRAGLHLNYGAALLQLGRLEEADRAIRRGLEVDPNHAGLRINLALLRIREESWDEARALLEETVAAHGGEAEAFAYLGWLHAREGRLADALPLLERACALKPRWDYALENRARVAGMLIAQRAEVHVRNGWERCGAGKLEDGLRELYYALRLAPDHALAKHYVSVARQKAEENMALDESEDPGKAADLAAAFAVEGAWDEARRWAENALLLAKAAHDEKRAQSVRDRLALYEQKIAFPLPALDAGARP